MIFLRIEMGDQHGNSLMLVGPSETERVWARIINNNSGLRYSPILCESIGSK